MAPMLVGRRPSHMPFPRARLRRLGWVAPLAALAPLRLAQFEILSGLPPEAPAQGAFAKLAPSSACCCLFLIQATQNRDSAQGRLMPVFSQLSPRIALVVPVAPEPHDTAPSTWTAAWGGRIATLRESARCRLRGGAPFFFMRFRSNSAPSGRVHIVTGTVKSNERFSGGRTP